MGDAIWAQSWTLTCLTAILLSFATYAACSFRGGLHGRRKILAPEIIPVPHVFYIQLTCKKLFCL